MTIKGFMSIRHLENFQLGPLTLLIGSNGAGKSNLVSYFRMLREMVEGRLQSWTQRQGGADRIVSFGVKETSQIESMLVFGRNAYAFQLEPTVAGGFTFKEEHFWFDGDLKGPVSRDPGQGHTESRLKESAESSPTKNIAYYCYHPISRWKVFHFHDTSATAGVKRKGALHDNAYLRPDASNLAAYLYALQRALPDVYQQIRKTVQLAIPFFDDFHLQPEELDSGEAQINLLWRQQDSDYPFWPSQLSDGSIRFICLVTALMQPTPPATIIIDEPELGLHPYAITLLGALLRSASKRMQVIVSTQSVPLVNEFSIEDLVIVEREQGASVFKRLDEKEFADWLQDYSVGELWEKNVLGGRPRP